MSQSPDAANPDESETKSYRDGWATVYRMIRQGKSWSGRERHCAFLNTGGPRFADVSAVAGLDLQDDGRALATVDWDGDGGLDFWVTNRNAPRVHLLRNRRADGHHWVQLALQGTSCNRDAIGARVEVVPAGGKAGARRHVQTLCAGQGFLAQSSKVLHFGLGDADAIERVIVRWPGGDEEEFSGVEADGRWRLVQGSGAAAGVPGRAVRLAASTPAVPETSGRGRVALPAPLPLPRLSHQDEEGRDVLLAPPTEGVLLVNLWASWCANCKKELREFHEHADELAAAGVKVLPLSVDEEAARPDARKYLRRMGWSGPRGWATDPLVDVLRTAEEEVLDPQRELALPTSFLIGAQGRLLAIYRGPVEVETLIADARLDGLEPEALRDAVVPFPGRWIGPTPVADLLTFANRLRDRGHLDLAADYLRRLVPKEDMAGPSVTADIVASQLVLAAEFVGLRRFADARAAYERILALDENCAAARRGLGLALSELGEGALAFAELERARALEPDDDSTLYLMGMLLARDEQHLRAASLLSEAVEKNPGNAKAWFNLGAVYSKQSLGADALAAMESALEADPEYVDAHRARAQLLHAANRIPEALDAYRTALELDGAHPQTLYGYALAQLQSGDKTGASRTYDELEKVDAALARQLWGVISGR